MARHPFPKPFPVAAYPVTGPKDVIGSHPIGVLNEDLREACLGALSLSREACRTFALQHTWDNSALQFLGHANRVFMNAFDRGRHDPVPVTAEATPRFGIGAAGVGPAVGGAAASRSR